MEYRKNDFYSHSEAILNSIVFEKKFKICDAYLGELDVVCVIKKEPLGTENCYVIYNFMGELVCDTYERTTDDLLERVCKHFIKKSLYKRMKSRIVNANTEVVIAEWSMLNSFVMYSEPYYDQELYLPYSKVGLKGGNYVWE
jgi:hypothetical protein